jgi:hypothetical protein
MVTPQSFFAFFFFEDTNAQGPNHEQYDLYILEAK